MILYCPTDNEPLQSVGRVNTFFCGSCKCIFEVSFSIIRISGPINNDEFAYQYPALTAESSSIKGSVE